MATDDQFDYSEYDEGSPDESAMAELTRIAARMRSEEAEVARLERELKKAKTVLKNTVEEVLPAKMDELGVQEFTTSSGLHVKIRKDVFGSLPKDAEKRREALEWLTKHGYESLIKDSFALSFDKGSHERAEALGKLLLEAGYGYDRKEDVHHSTLKAFIREKLRDGEEVPIDTLGVHERRFAVIK